MPRGPHDSHGLSTTRSPVSARRPTTSWPSTWGKDTSAVSGLSRAPFRRICFTSEPHRPEKVVSPAPQPPGGRRRPAAAREGGGRKGGDDRAPAGAPADGRGRLAGQAVPEYERLHVDSPSARGSPTYQCDRAAAACMHLAYGLVTVCRCTRPTGGSGWCAIPGHSNRKCVLLAG